MTDTTTIKEVLLPCAEVTITECATMAFTELAERKRLFTRDRKIAQVTRDGIIEVINAHNLRSILEEAGRVKRLREEDGVRWWEACPCPEATASALLHCEVARKVLPPIKALVELPPLALEDTKPRLLGLGWNSFNGGTYVKKAISGKTPASLDEAVAALLRLLVDCDFTTPSDKSRAVASLISPALKMGCWIEGPVPLDFAEADQSQSGKSYRQRVIAAVYGERMMVVTQRNGGVGSLDEDISMRLIKGRPFIQLDNIRGKLNSPQLEAIMTGDETEVAVRGFMAQMDVSPEPFIWYLSTNGLETTVDFMNRVNIIRIRKRPDSYEWASCAEGDLMKHVKASGGYYLACIHTVLLAWHAAGMLREKSSGTSGAFRDWAQSCDWIVQNIFRLAPLLDGHAAAKKRSSSPRLSWLRDITIAVLKRGIPEVSTAGLTALCVENNLMPPGLSKPDDRTAISKSIGMTMLGIFKAGEDGYAFEGYRIERTNRSYNDTRPDWVYKFTNSAP